MKVLKRKQSISDARDILIRMGASALEPRMRTILRRLHLSKGVAVGDRVKSWDVLESIDLILKEVKSDEPILDIGCYASEVVVALYKLGYTDLTGVDLNPNIGDMPHQESIKYVSGNFMQMPFSGGKFRAVTAISVIEHGLNAPQLLLEVSRVLMPNGIFIISFDYWPEKIDTTGIRYFDMDWRIFSAPEVSDLIAEAALHGLFPINPLDLKSQDRVVSYSERRYTFGWMALRKVG